MGSPFGVAAAEDDDGCLRVRLTGELDIATAARLRDEIRRLIDREPDRLIVDLSGLDFIDAAGVGTLIGLWRHARRCGCRMWVTSPGPAVEKVLQVTGTYKLLTSPDSMKGWNG